MAASTAIPETVELPGQVLFDALVALLEVENELDDLLEIPPDSLHSAFFNLHEAAFGPLYRPCDLGTEARGCRCRACNGPERETATPMYAKIIDATNRQSTELIAA